MATALRAVIFGSQIPSYTPTDAGNENEAYDAAGKSTEETGDEAGQIATDAYNELCSGTPDAEASATALYKLKDLLPKLYTQAEAA